MTAPTVQVVNLTLTPILLRLENAGLFVDMPPETLRSYARRGDIPTVRIGRSLYFAVADLEAFVAAHRETAAADRR